MKGIYHYWRYLAAVLFLAILPGMLCANTGKISGLVIDKATGEPLPGANVIVEGEPVGAATDKDGFFFILNLPPGEYTLRAEMIGYGVLVQENVKVTVNQTTQTRFELSEEAIQGETVVVQAERQVVQMDVTSSKRVVTQEAIAQRPLDNLEEILASEVGIDVTAGTEGSGLVVRGGELNETDIVVDGLSTRNLRNGQPFTNLSVTAINEVEVLTGGFSAEFGEIRSGFVNVVTKEGGENLELALDYRFSPPGRKHFGPSPFGVEGPFWQVYTGSDAFTGVSETQVSSGEYPFAFVGWNEVSRQFLSDPDPDNDLTPQALLELWKWQHRDRPYANKPDHIFDATLTGPLPKTPFNFMLSQRYEDLQLVYPFSRNNSIASTTLLKLTTYLNPKMKLSINNSFLLVKGVSGSIFDDTNGIITGSREGTYYARDIHFYRYIWHDANFNPVESRQYRGGLSFNHVLSPQSYYDLRMEYTNYSTQQSPIGARDTTGVKEIGGRFYNEEPFGYVGGDNITEQFDVLGEFLMSGGGRGRDNSTYHGVKFTGDYVNQFNNYNQLKMGISLDYTTFKERREINNTADTQPFEENPTVWYRYDASPLKLGAYLQDKLEYEGMIANIGMRLDYLDPRREAFNLDPSYIFRDLPYTYSQYQGNGNSFEFLTTGDKTYKLYWSPRLGVSHPLTSTSKIFFNYGHYYQPPVNNQLYTVRTNGSVAFVPRVDADWPKTVSYELGYEQSLPRGFLMHFMGYYKDVTNQLSPLTIRSLDNVSNVSTFANNSYSDIRGIEMRLEKRLGDWVNGWVSLEYLIQSTGLSGFGTIYEDRQLADQQRNQATQFREDPVPSFSTNLTFKTPVKFGPAMGAIRPLGDWRLNVLFEWSDGGTTLLTESARLSDQIRVDVIDYHNTDLLLEKRFNFSERRMGFYMQVRNLFNYRGFPNPFNYNEYRDSLKFPHEQGDENGNDKLGDWDKDYIKLGRNTWSQFVNPRDIFFGVRVNL